MATTDAAPTEASLVDALGKLKTQGNAHFTSKQFAEAIAVYSQAVDAVSSDAAKALVGSSSSLGLLVAQVFANRSAAHYELGVKASGATETAHYTAALEDAVHAVGAAPTWPKAHLRKGQALQALSRPREASAAYGAARKLDPTDKAVVRLIKSVESAAVKADFSEPINSIEHFVMVFSALGADIRSRLATLATFWNEAAVDDRWQVFKRFLAIVAGPTAIDESYNPDTDATGKYTGPHISHFKPETLTTLPMHNYADIALPVHWVKFFRGLPDAAARVRLFNACWDACTMQEQVMIISDIKTFFAPTSEEDEAVAAAARAAEAAALAGDARGGAAAARRAISGSAEAAADGSGALVPAARSGGGRYAGVRSAKGGAGIGGILAAPATSNAAAAAAAAALAGLTAEDLMRILTAAGASGAPLRVATVAPAATGGAAASTSTLSPAADSKPAAGGDGAAGAVTAAPADAATAAPAVGGATP